MSAKGVPLLVSEYHILWEALAHYEARLEKLSEMSTDEDQQLRYDEKLQDMANLKQTVKTAAAQDWDLSLS